jgi:2-polyprenyl-3-methyl-5-hydroxy-6-metoxy-1,4-benzoquinol methylase
MNSGNGNNDSYFRARNVRAETYKDYTLPRHIVDILPADKNSAILDIGSGYCQMLRSLRAMGFGNLRGVDVSPDAVEQGLEQGLDVSLISDLTTYLQTASATYDLVLMSHVIEHIDKDRIIDILRLIRARILSPSGVLYLATPNAQSVTDCYWAYEDFTHTTIFTGGSIAYVLRRAGYETVTFLDQDGLQYLSKPKKMLKYALQSVYRTNRRFWNRIMNCSYHRPSPQIYAWELRLIAR